MFRPVTIDGVRYRSKGAAAEALKVHPSRIERACRQAGFEFSSEELNRPPPKPKRTGNYHGGLSVPVTIDGVCYPSSMAAARAINFPEPQRLRLICRHRLGNEFTRADLDKVLGDLHDRKPDKRTR